MSNEENQLREKLKDRYWRLNNLYYIKDKNGKKVKFRMNWAQRKLYREMWFYNIILKARQLGFCLDPSTKVLTADLKWVAISDLEIGQKLVAVDEHKPGGRGKQRKMRTAEIEGVVEVKRKAYRITLDNGHEVVCTGHHPWLCRKASTDTKWMSILGGDKPKIKIGTKIRSVCSMWGESNYEDGWFGGLIDGEGSMAKPSASGAEVNVSQVDGVVWERIKSYLDGDYNYRIETDNRKSGETSKLGNKAVHKACVSRIDELFKLVGKTRPSKFIGREFWEGKELPGKGVHSNLWRTVVKIEELGEQIMIDLQTSTGTYIAEGLVSHNTTFTMIYFLDACLFNSNHSAGVIAHTKEDATDLFDNKIKYAYKHLPDWLKALRKAEQDSARKLEFSNGSSISVGTSLRSGTYQKLLVSELGKLAAKYPEKAREVKSGALNTVEQGQQIFVESTAEGKTGIFYDLCELARKLRDTGRQLSRLEPRFHFFPWFDNPEYKLTPEETEAVTIPRDLADYLDKIEGITKEQKAWYAVKKVTQGDDMKREYPSNPEEAFEGSLEGAYYTEEMKQLREDEQITNVPYDSRYQVHTFWDLGQGSDLMTIWFYQFIDNQHLFIDYHESNNQAWSYYAMYLKDKKYNYGTHYFPHDGKKRVMGEQIFTTQDIAQKVGISPVRIVTRTDNVWNDIRAYCKPLLPLCWFDAEKCAQGITHLDNYKRKFDKTNNIWLNEPQHNEASHGSDGFRTFVMARQQGLLIFDDYDDNGMEDFDMGFDRDMISGY